MCPEKAKNGGSCPHHNLQCGWPGCDPEYAAQEAAAGSAAPGDIALSLSACIDKRAKKAGSLRKLAASAGLDVGYLSRLRSGEKQTPSEPVLSALGIERVTTYRLSRLPPQPFPRMSAACAAAYHGAEEEA